MRTETTAILCCCLMLTLQVPFLSQKKKNKKKKHLKKKICILSILPFLSGLLYHLSFLMSEMVILTDGFSTKILCSRAENKILRQHLQESCRLEKPIACSVKHTFSIALLMSKYYFWGRENKATKFLLECHAIIPCYYLYLWIFFPDQTLSCLQIEQEPGGNVSLHLMIFTQR